MNLDDPWYCGEDAALLFGYARPEEAIRDHVKDTEKCTIRALSECKHFDHLETLHRLEEDILDSIYITRYGVFSLSFRRVLEIYPHKKALQLETHELAWKNTGIVHTYEDVHFTYQQSILDSIYSNRPYCRTTTESSSHMLTNERPSI